MSTAVLADAQFGVARILRPYSGFAGGYFRQIVDPFTVPPGPSGFNVVVDQPFTNVFGNVWISIPGIGNFRVSSVSGTTLGLVWPADPLNRYPWLAYNQSGTFDPGVTGPYYISGPGNYDGRPGELPLMFTEGGVVYDDLAGKIGYDSKLLRGLPVPMGSRVLIWLPNFDDTAKLPEDEGLYQWEFFFRLRSLADFRANRSPYHLPTSTPVGREPSYLIPGARHTVVYNGAEPTAGARIVTQRVIAEGFSTSVGIGITPLTPDEFYLNSFGNGGGRIEQYGVSSYPSFDILEIQCAGDELLIGLTKKNGNWDFSGGSVPQDRQVRDKIVYVFPGSAP